MLFPGAWAENGTRSTFPETVQYPSQCTALCVKLKTSHPAYFKMHQTVSRQIEKWRKSCCRPGELPRYDVVMAFEWYLENSGGVRFAEFPVCSGQAGRTAPKHVFCELSTNAAFEVGAYAGLSLRLMYKDYVQLDREIPEGLGSDVGILQSYDEAEWIESLLKTGTLLGNRRVQRLRCIRLHVALDNALDVWKVASQGVEVFDVQLGVSMPKPTRGGDGATSEEGGWFSGTSANLLSPVLADLAPLAASLGIDPSELAEVTNELPAEGSPYDISGNVGHDSDSDEYAVDSDVSDFDDDAPSAVEHLLAPAVPEALPQPPYDIASILQWAEHIHDPKAIVNMLSSAGHKVTLDNGVTVKWNGIKVGRVWCIAGKCIACDCSCDHKPMNGSAKCRLKLHWAMPQNKASLDYLEAQCVKWILAGTQTSAIEHQRQAVALHALVNKV